MPHPRHVPTPGALNTGEFVRVDEAARLAVAHLGPNGRCYGSMSGYRARTPDHLVVKNANVCTKEHGKLWWGDCDVTLVAPELRALARALEVTVYVLPEWAGRFEHASAPRLERACYATDGSDEGFVPTQAWMLDTWEARRRAIERQPGRLTVHYSEHGPSWTLVNEAGESCPISAAEAKEECARRGLPWDAAWDE